LIPRRTPPILLVHEPRPDETRFPFGYPVHADFATHGRCIRFQAARRPRPAGADDPGHSRHLSGRRRRFRQAAALRTRTRPLLEAGGPPHSAVLGRSGLAWGRGLHRIPPDAPRKAEGDGKAPAGVFELGTAFGYEEEPPAAFRWRYRQATKRDFFVDDPDARNYNEWVNLRRGDPESRWASFERMRRQDQLYRLGLVVKHNTDPIVPGAGSAIFLHVWRGPGEPTAGCTALAENDLRTLLQWLRPRRHPLLIQIARSQLSLLRLEIAPKP